MTMRIALLVLSMVVLEANADVYKYVDSSGNVYFSDGPLQGKDLRLEWKRSNSHLVAEQQQRTEEWRAHREAPPTRVELATGRVGTPPRPPAPRGSLAQRRARYSALIERTARQYNLWPELLHAVIRAESSYQVDALSPAGACGLMQLMPATAERFRVRDIWDPAENLRGGAVYLRYLLDLFDNDLRLALAGYNAGENAVKRHGYRIPPYAETQTYVQRVLQFLHAERLAFQP